MFMQAMAGMDEDAVSVAMHPLDDVVVDGAEKLEYDTEILPMVNFPWIRAWLDRAGHGLKKYYEMRHRTAGETYFSRR